MRKSYLVLAAVSLMALTSYLSYDYGVTKTELVYTQTDKGVLIAANTERTEQTATESQNVIASLGNAVARDTEIEKLREEVAGYEAKLQKDRTVACNLSADSIASMQQHARKGASEQLGASAGINIEPAAHIDSSTINWQSSGNGRYLVDKRRHSRRSDLQPHRYTAGYKIAPEAKITTWPG